MTSKQFITALSKATKLSAAETDERLNHLSEAIAEQLLKGNTINIEGLGTLAIKQKNARKVYNIRTQEYTTTSPSLTAAFHPSPALKERLNP